MAKEEVVGVSEEYEQDVDLDTTFSFPLTLTEHSVLGKRLIIAPEHANWLVCSNEEYEAFCLFREGNSIQKVEALLRLEARKAREIVSRLVAQILGKEFSLDAVIRERPIFKVLSLYLTAGCNLRCTTCLLRCTVAGADECEFIHWKRVLKAFKDVGGQIVTLTGGEPMLNPDCVRIMQYAKRIGHNVLLLTNGTLVAPENAAFLGESCGQIRISIDGPDANTHDSIRGKGMFDKAISALRELSAYPHCQLSVAMTPTPATLPSFWSGLRQFSEWVLAEIRSDINFEVTGRLMEGRNIPCMSKSEKQAFRSEVCDLCNDQLGKDFIQKMDAVNIVPNRRVLGCGLAEIVSVLANGDVGLCAYSPGPFCNIKNLGDGNGKTFWVDLAGRVGELVNSTTIDGLRPCSDCDLRYFCGGKCRQENIDDCGDPNNCECDMLYRAGWYEELVRINPYVVEPLTDLEERR